MTPERCYFRVNKLVVLAHKGVALDLDFHEGVNIIRGDNGSGKSSIMDFLFFSLGGDFKKWKLEASLCDTVYVEVSINGTPAVLRRFVTKKSMQSMEIFWGSFADLENAPETDWNVFPFKRSEKKQSFSQVLFSAIGLPEVWGDHDSNITMHQLLRVLYIDQLSHVQSLIREEQFDSPLTRETIAELLLGLYDKDLYVDQLEHRKKQKELEQVRSQLKTFSEVFAAVDQAGESYEFLESQVENSKLQLIEVQETINAQEWVEEDSSSEIDSAELVAQKSTYIKKRQAFEDAQEQIKVLEFQLLDSSDFLAALSDRIAAIDDALLVKKVLAEDFLKICPACMQPVETSEGGDECFLCKQPVDKEKARSDLMRMRQELVFQQKESERLYADKKDELEKITASVKTIKEELGVAKSNLEASLNSVKTVRSAEKDALHERKGTLESQIESLLSRMKVFQVQRDLDKKNELLTGTISALEIRIKRARMRHASRSMEVYDVIAKYAKVLLEADLPREAEFQHVNNVQIDFRLNTFGVNQKNNFSASSVFYLKNSIHYALFFAAMELSYIRYPRLLLCDNMEDKGMEQARSHNFQKKIVDMASEFGEPHQIIFSTSMIHPDLEDSALCVGPHFTEANKALKNV
ncbi:AAA family ATPase [Tichowtungia aerotolerans]|uniref:AAA family ATPase n=1 Tax=Tichowtungia aerotolerans TaxID=2697043 RepID=A0A6P1M2F3_9BACT|nr:AAA family ATPase [Tichowtungia aerotolerans]QHI68770.1 AAA family ATPase [Tichowtungia aerotolerans]